MGSRRNNAQPDPGGATKRRLLPWALAAVGFGVAVLPTIAGYWGLRKLAHEVVDREPTEFPVRVLSMDAAAGIFVLNSTQQALHRGRYALQTPSGQLIGHIGDILRVLPDGVERELLDIEADSEILGVPLRLAAAYYLSPAELDLDFTEVTYESPLGPNPAWLLAGAAAGDWVIHVHGRGAARSECLRAVAAFADRGYSGLVISYRNDIGASATASAQYGLGLGEADDVVAAVRYAVAAGAKRVVLVGWSMGGAAVLHAGVHPTVQKVLQGLVFESAVFDWATTLKHQASGKGVPGWFSSIGLRVLSSAKLGRFFGVSTDPVGERAAVVEPPVELLGRVPTLIFYSDVDSVVPSPPARRLAEKYGASVRVLASPYAGHARIWNADPAAFEAKLGDWLDYLAGRAATRSRT